MTKAQKAIKKVAKARAKAIKEDKSIPKKDRTVLADKAVQEADKQIEALAMLNPLAGASAVGRPCVICEAPIRLGQHYRVIGFKGDEPYARHEACAPGTERWLKSKVGQMSANRKYFPEKEVADVLS